MEEIQRINQKCLWYLLKLHETDKNFRFMLRQRNNENRLENKHYFIGGNECVHIGFWRGGNATQKIYNIGFVIHQVKGIYIELTFYKEPKKEKHIKEIINRIKQHSDIAFKEIIVKKDDIKDATLQYHYPKTENYLNVLQSFITELKPAIDEYIEQSPECQASGIEMISEEKFDEMLNRILENENSELIMEQGVLKEKKTGKTYCVKTIESWISHRHNELSMALEKHLRNNGYKNVRAESDYVDIKAEKDGERIYFEIKVADSVRCAIRQSLGQLLEYNHYKKGNKAAQKLVLVTEKGTDATEQDRDYIRLLQEKYNIPFYYWQYDMEQDCLSQIV